MSRNSRTSVIGMALVGVIAHGTLASAGESVSNENIAAIYAPDTRAAAQETGQSAAGTSILDGIARDWRDPSRTVTGDAAVAANRTGNGVAGATSVEKSLRDVYNAYSAN